MKPGNIAHQVIEAVSCHSSGCVKVDTVKPLHDVCVVRNLKIRYHGIAKTLHFHIFTVILADGHGWVNNVGNGHHDFGNLLRKLSFLFLQLCQTCGIGADLLLHGLCLILFSLAHQHANLLGQLIAAGP